MKLEHRFTVPARVGEVWAALLDPHRVAPCLPGATLTEVTGDTFEGTVKVKLGPISLLYKGNGQFLERDDDAHKLVIKASGKDSRGNGTAAATVTVTLVDEGDATGGTVVSNLAITGKPAQFGRGLISEVGGKILDTFATCLADKLAPPTGEQDATPVAEPDPPQAQDTGQAAPEPGESTEPTEDAATEQSQPPAESTDSPEPVGEKQEDQPEPEPRPDVPRPADDEAEKPQGAPVRSAPEAESGDGGAASAEVSGAESRGGSDLARSVSDVEPDAGVVLPVGVSAAKSRGGSGPVRSVPEVESGDGGAAPAGVSGAESRGGSGPVRSVPEAEPIDLLEFAGPSLARRVAPVLVAVLVALIVLAVRRRGR